MNTLEIILQLESRKPRAARSRCVPNKFLSPSFLWRFSWKYHFRFVSDRIHSRSPIIRLARRRIV